MNRAMGVEAYGDSTRFGKGRLEKKTRETKLWLWSYCASGTAGAFGFCCCAGAGAGPGAGVFAGWLRCSGTASLAIEVSILVGSRVAPAITAMTIDRTMKMPPRIAVERVRKSAAPRAVMNPDELPPTPRPPPSERCIRITLIRDVATRNWTISRNFRSMGGFLGSGVGAI